jgi:hypothetical protein
LVQRARQYASLDSDGFKRKVAWFMLSTYKTKAEFLNAALLRLQLEESQADIGSALLSGISSAEDDIREDALDDESQAFHLKVGSWIIRDDDLPILEAVSSMATAVALTLSTAGIAWPAIATALSQIANVCWRVWRRGAQLSAPQVAVYGFLKTQGPLKVNALAEGLNKAGKDLTQDDVASTLSSLCEIELRSGQFIKLATKDANEYWKALNI